MDLNVKRLFARSTGGLDVVGPPSAAVAALGEAAADVRHAGGDPRRDRRGRGGLLFCDAHGDLADRGRPGQQRRRQGGSGAVAGLCPGARPDPFAPDADRRRPAERQGAGGGQSRSRHHPGRSRSAEECPGRGDAAQERRGAVGAAGGKGQRQEGGAEDHEDRRSFPGTASAWSAAPKPMSICSR